MRNASHDDDSIQGARLDRIPFPSRGELGSRITKRTRSFFHSDVTATSERLRALLADKRALIVGGAGSIGSATVAQLTGFDLATLHVVDISENNLTELVRDLRSRRGGLGTRDFRTLPLDFGSPIMKQFLFDQAPYDYVLNFAAIKHVRSEKDSFSLIQMFDTNVVRPARFLGWLAERGGVQSYFCVSTDKAANPVNLMGASKRLMEHTVFSDVAVKDASFATTSARFANVAFSDGSLLDGWLKRIDKRQPVAVPRGVRRFFLSLKEAGQLCLLATMCAPDRHVLIPRFTGEFELVELEHVARELLVYFGCEPEDYVDEHSARAAIADDLARGRYPLLITRLDTSGEKPYEEFVGRGEEAVDIGLRNLEAVPYLRGDPEALSACLDFLKSIVAGRKQIPSKKRIIECIRNAIPELDHKETGKQLDQRM